MKSAQCLPFISIFFCRTDALSFCQFFLHILQPAASTVVQWQQSSNTHTHACTFNGSFSGTTRVSRYQKGKTNLDFTEARDSEWQWHQLGDMQVCTSLQTDNHASTSRLSFLQAGCPSCRPFNYYTAVCTKGQQQYSNYQNITKMTNIFICSHSNVLLCFIYVCEHCDKPLYINLL